MDPFKLITDKTTEFVKTAIDNTRVVIPNVDKNNAGYFHEDKLVKTPTQSSCLKNKEIFDGPSRDKLNAILQSSDHDTINNISSAEIKLASPEEKAKIITKLLDGITGTYEENTIIKILQSSEQSKDSSRVILELNRLNYLNQLLDDVNGDEYDKLVEVLPKLANTKESATVLIKSLANDLSDKNKLAIHHTLDTATKNKFIYNLDPTVKNYLSNASIWTKPFWESIEKRTDQVQFQKLNRPEIIAHRGGPAEYPENTMQCIKAGLKSGAESIEIDVTVTKDNKIVLWHDFDPGFALNATTGRNLGLEPGMKYRPTLPDIGSPYRKPVYTLNLNDVQKNFGYSGPDGAVSGFEIPTFDQVTKLAKEYPNLKKIYLDVKLPEGNKEIQEKFSNAFTQIANDPELKDKIVLLNNNNGTLKNLKAFIGKDYNFSFDREDLNSLSRNVLPDATSETKGNTYVSAGDPKHPLSAYRFPDYVQMLKNARETVDNEKVKQKIVAWTINDELKFRELVSVSLDGVMTDKPEEFKAVLDKIFINKKQ